MMKTLSVCFLALATQSEGFQMLRRDLQTDPNCHQWNLQEDKCDQCSWRYFFNEDGICSQIDDTCRTWSDRGDCLTCYQGYVVNSENKRECILDQ